MSDGGQDTSLFPEDDFPYMIIICAVLIHLAVMAVVIYYSCCKNKCCECRINIQNNTIHQNSLRENARISAIIPRGDSPDSENLVDNNERPVTNWNTSLLARVQARLQRATEARTAAVTADGLPPPYSAGESTSGHVNVGANFEDIDLHLPSYEDTVGQLPSWTENDETGRIEMEKPPTYEEATEAKRRDKQ